MLANKQYFGENKLKMSQQISIDWQSFEQFIGEGIPNCVKKILSLAGYSNFISMREIKQLELTKIQTFISQYRHENVKQLDCCYSNFYRQQENFNLLPGHEAIILALPKYIGEYLRETRPIVHERRRKYSFILEEMIETAESNLSRDEQHPRFPDSIRFFFTFIFLVCGRFCYEMLQANLPIPSTKTILRCIDNTKERIVEGKLRAKELSEYLERLKCTKSVWLSEDATAIISKVVYDSSTDQLVGLVLPTNQSNGCPKAVSFTAKNAEVIKEYLKQERSTVLYLVMAQPLDESIPPFVLQMFGSDNKFKSEHVLKRWNYTITELKQYGVEVIGWSSDGDPKLLSAMCFEMIHQQNGVSCVQDTTHIATKLRNRLLKPGINLLMGTARVSVAHLKSLVRAVNKSVHGLSESDVCPIDRQNFRSFEKIVNVRVIEALRVRINGCEGTIKYLEMCSEIVSSFLDSELKPEERVFRIYHALYFLRIWRNYIMQSSHATLKNNFITHNAYSCIEINAKTIVRLIKKFRDEKTPHLFIPALFDSQTCEKTFRQLRSMGTVDFTRINFTLYDLLHMIGRIEVQNDIAFHKLSSTGVSFPFVNKRAKKNSIFELPDDLKIKSIIEEAKLAATSEAQVFGMNSNDIDEYRFRTNLSLAENDKENFEEEDDEDIDNMLEEPFENQDSHEGSRFTTVIDENGDERILRKSTLVWMLTEPGVGLSKDRLRRVQLGKRKAPSQ